MSMDDMPEAVQVHNISLSMACKFTLSAHFKDRKSSALKFQRSSVAAYTLLLVNCVLFSLYEVVVVKLDPLSASQIAATVSLGGILVSLVHMWLATGRIDPFAKSGNWLIAEGFSLGVADAIFVYGMTQLPIGDATSLFCAQPAFTIVISLVFLKMRPTKLEVLASLVSIAGAVLVAQPSGKTNYGPAQAVASCLMIFAAIIAGGVPVIMTQLKDVHPSHLTFHYSLWGFLVNGIWFLAQGGPGLIAASTEAGLYLLLGLVLSYAAALALQHAMQLPVRPQVVSILEQTSVLITYIFQATILHQHALVSAGSLTGAALIILSSVLNIFDRKQFEPHTVDESPNPSPNADAPQALSITITADSVCESAADSFADSLALLHPQNCSNS